MLGEAERYLNHFSYLIALVFADYVFIDKGIAWYWIAILWWILYFRWATGKLWWCH
jgi:hypothetical protein